MKWLLFSIWNVRWDCLRAHTQTLGGSNEFLTLVHNERRCKRRYRNFPSRVCVCVCVLVTAQGFYCGSKWKHNAPDDDDVEYKHDFILSHWARRFQFSSTNNTFDIYWIIRTTYEIFSFCFTLHLFIQTVHLATGFFLCVLIYFFSPTKWNGTIHYLSIQST